MAANEKKSPKKSPAKKAGKKQAAAPQAAPESDVVPPQAVNPLLALRGEIDQMFENMMSGLPAMRLQRPHFDMDVRDFWREPFFRDPFRRFEGGLQQLSKLSPRADLEETGKAITITVELPGVTEDGIDISASEGRITIRAEKKEETRKDDADYHLSERHYGVVERTFSLPDSADPDKAKAGFKDGVLTIEVPKKALPKSATRKIPIQG